MTDHIDPWTDKPATLRGLVESLAIVRAEAASSKRYVADLDEVADELLIPLDRLTKNDLSDVPIDPWTKRPATVSDLVERLVELRAEVRHSKRDLAHMEKLEDELLAVLSPLAKHESK